MTTMNVSFSVVHGRPQGKRLTFPLGEFYFGRGTECHLRPNSEWVSRQHCRLRVTPSGAFLRDLGSTNGTLINGQLVTAERQLSEGDQIQLGPLVLEVCFPSPATPGTDLSMTLDDTDQTHRTLPADS
jgi:pSer/pThr/pTyr-binding forkhead associated (FHA) protein